MGERRPLLIQMKRWARRLRSQHLHHVHQRVWSPPSPSSLRSSLTDLSMWRAACQRVAFPSTAHCRCRPCCLPRRCRFRRSFAAIITCIVALLAADALVSYPVRAADGSGSWAGSDLCAPTCWQPPAGPRASAAWRATCPRSSASSSSSSSKKGRAPRCDRGRSNPSAVRVLLLNACANALTSLCELI